MQKLTSFVTQTATSSPPPITTKAAAPSRTAAATPPRCPTRTSSLCSYPSSPSSRIRMYLNKCMPLSLQLEFLDKSKAIKVLQTAKILKPSRLYKTRYKEFICNSRLKKLANLLGSLPSNPLRPHHRVEHQPGPDPRRPQRRPAQPDHPLTGDNHHCLKLTAVATLVVHPQSRSP